VTRDLSANPAWQEQDLGLPLPDSAHACSVCLPTWDSVVGYEEGREKILKRMRIGYPRFFKNPTVERLFDNAKAEVASDHEEVLVLPTRTSVQRAHRWIERRAETAVRITSTGSKSRLIVRALTKFSGFTADNTFVFASGMAAVTSVLRALPGVCIGKKTLQLEFPYVDCLKVQELFGHGVVYLNEAHGESFD
jgi:cystathionine gamma-synthase